MTTETKAARLGNWSDERLGASKGVKFLARKIFPDHWSFMLGEVALYSFIILLLTGVFLSFFFVPSAGPTTYQGVYDPLVNQHVSEAYASTVRLSFDIRGGLLMRQIHHWAALIFVAAMTVHMFRVFFTGAFRKPRELNWVIGSILVLLGIIEGFAGYSLPDDLLSGTGLRIASSIVLAIPVIGSYLSFFMFGGEFPGEALIPRLYTVHVLLLPAIFLALIGAHLVMLVIQKHTQYPGPGRTNKNVVGFPLYPIYVAKAGGFFFIVFGITTLLSALVTINPVWVFGGYDPSPVSAGTQPDWYMGFLDGAVRLTPGWLEVPLGGFTLSLNILLPALIVPGLMTIPMILYPWIEQWATGDRREHHLLDRPRNAPTRTGLGAMAITFYLLLWLGGGNDIMAKLLQLSINDITLTLRVLVIVLPPLVYWLVKRVCLGLQRKDREKVLHGRETGVIVRTETGEYFEVHAPLDEYSRWELVQHETNSPLPELEAEDENGVRRQGGSSRWRRRLSNFYFEERVAPVTPAELAAAHHDHHEHEAIESDAGSPAIGSGSSH
ncbi:MAG: ubiquinol-cytochrome c reductase cytochrome b subunit [Kineosporiaceae bacterium]|jgi:ubiquinol-cytochrome c reductase cytochrome b subunit